MLGNYIGKRTKKKVSARVCARALMRSHILPYRVHSLPWITCKVTAQPRVFHILLCLRPSLSYSLL